MERKTIALGSTVELCVPAVKEMMLVIRLTAAAVMARTGISADSMDEMKMAVEEAAHCLMQAGYISSIRLAFVRVSDGVSITLRGVAEESVCPKADQRHLFSEDEIAVIRCVLESMADEVILSMDCGRICAIELLSRTVK